MSVPDDEAEAAIVGPGAWRAQWWWTAQMKGGAFNKIVLQNSQLFGEEYEPETRNQNCHR